MSCAACVRRRYSTNSCIGCDPPLRVSQLVLGLAFLALLVTASRSAPANFSKMTAMPAHWLTVFGTGFIVYLFHPHIRAMVPAYCARKTVACSALAKEMSLTVPLGEVCHGSRTGADPVLLSFVAICHRTNNTVTSNLSILRGFVTISGLVLLQ